MDIIYLHIQIIARVDINVKLKSGYVSSIYLKSGKIQNISGL